MSEQLSEQCRNRKQETGRTYRRHAGRKPSEQEIIDALHGRTVAEAARLLGYTGGGLRYVMTGYGIEFRRRLSEGDIGLIVKLIDEGLTREEVAEKFDVTEETISAHYHKIKGTYLPNARNKPRNEARGSE